MTTFSETTLPALVFTVPAGHPKGTASALGRLTINEAQGADQTFVVWGVETSDRYDITASSAALFYEAESRTPLGGAAVGSFTGFSPSPAGSTSSNVVNHTTVPAQPITVLSTQASGGGAHLSHVGSFRVWLRARVAADRGATDDTVTFALEWGYGDFLNFTRNTSVSITPETFGFGYKLMDLGIVTIPKLAGTQRWEGRITAQAAVAGASIQLDSLFLVPTDYGTGEATGTTRAPTSLTYTALDSFDQTAGALATKSLTIGGTWSGAGSATDFNASGAATATRSATDGALTTGRYEIAGSSTLTNVIAQIDVIYGTVNAGGTRVGVLVRYTDTSNWVMAILDLAGSGGTLPVRLIKAVAGTITIVATATYTLLTLNTYTIRVQIDSGGRYYVYVFKQGDAVPATALLQGQDADFATGGTLATGKVGMYDAQL